MSENIGAQKLADLLFAAERASPMLLNLTPSENSASLTSRLPFLLDSYNRYMFNPGLNPEEWNFRGAQEIAWAERDYVIDPLADLCPGARPNVRPLSGLHAMTVVMSALSEPGDHVASISPSTCGHYARAPLSRRLGRRSVQISGAVPGQLPTCSEVIECLRSYPDIDPRGEPR